MFNFAKGINRTPWQYADTPEEYGGTRKSTTSTTAPTSLTQSYTQMSEEAKKANEKRQTEITGIYDKIANMFAPGGSYGQSYIDQLNRRKVQDVSGAQQSDISSGLYGLRNRGNEWESSVGQPARRTLEDFLTEKYTGALGQKAGFLERIENPYPDYTLLAQAEAARASTPTYSKIINSTPSLWNRNLLQEQGFGY